jgi:hypothetical protein
MKYYLQLFSPETYEAFGRSDRTISGFRTRQRNAASRVERGDRLVSYMTKLHRWMGILEVVEGPFEVNSPIFYSASDPFVVRFRVRSVAWLRIEGGPYPRGSSVEQTLFHSRPIEEHVELDWEVAWVAWSNSMIQTGSSVDSLILTQLTAEATYAFDQLAFKRLWPVCT